VSIKKDEGQPKLFEVSPDWAEHWKGMPSYQHEDLMPQKSIKVHFRNEADFEAFARHMNQKIGPNQHAIWYPQLEIRSAVDKRFKVVETVSPKYPIYIISKGRWESRMTSKALEKIGVPYHICVEPQEYENYAAVIDPAKVLKLPEDFSKRGQGSIPVRNWVWEHSIAAGAERHWIMDDNIRGFYRFENNLKIPVGDGAIFRAAEDFTDRYTNVGQSGFQYYMFVVAKWGDRPPITLNTRIYSCILNRNDLPFRWRGRYNEDTDLSIRVLKSGMCTILFNAFLAEKMRTLTMKGGNMEELYKCEGRLKMAQSLAEQHPDLVHITEKWGRPQHEVYYKGFRKNKLVLKPETVIPEGQQNYGMELERVERRRPGIRAEPYQVRRAPPPITWTAPTELPSLRGVKRLCFDVETRDEELAQKGPGARRPECYIVGLALGTDDGRRVYLPVRHEGGGNLDSVNVFNWARSELNAFDGELVGANLLYDLDFAANEGITFPNVRVFHDVQVAEPLLDEWRQHYSLEALSQDYLGIGKNEALLREAASANGYGRDDAEVKRNLWRLPAGHVGAYAEADVDLPLMILEKQLPQLEEQGLMKVYDVERKLIPMLLAMRRRGVKIDYDKAAQARTRIAAERDRWLEQVRKLSSPKAEFMAPESFVDALRECGLKIPQTPKSGKPSVTAGFLRAHKEIPLVQAILVGRKLNTLINTFFDGHILGHNTRGRIHCSFTQLKGEDGGTIARFASRDPNLQNVPSRGDEEVTSLTGVDIPAEARSPFVPEEGEDWVRLDESQVEYRLLVHRALGPGAEEARRAYREDPKTDFHKMTADMVGINPEDKVRRRFVKSLNFAKTYGARGKRIAAYLGCSLQEAETFIKLYNTKLPFAKATFEAAQALVEKQGYITTILGRRQRFPFWEPSDNFEMKKPAFFREKALALYGPNIVRAKTYAALNRDLQGGGADVMKKAMVDAWEAGCYRELGGAPLLTVHDEQDLSRPRTPVGAEALAEVRWHMEKCFELRVPLVCDQEIGSNWGEAS